MIFRSKALAVVVLVAVMAFIIGAGSSVMARPGLWCSIATPCVAKSVEKSVEKAESTQKGWLGVEIQELTPELCEVLGLDEDTEGVLVAGVTEDGPAEKAGITKGDVILTLDAKRVEDTSELVSVVSNRKPGEMVTVAILRDGDKKIVKVTLGRRSKTSLEEFTMQAPKPGTREKGGTFEEEIPELQLPDLESLPPLEHFKFELNRGRLGVSVADLNTDLGGYFGSTKGVLVTEVLEGTAAEEAGIKAGDVIIKADGKPVVNREELVRILSKLEVGDKVELMLLRKSKQMKLSATLEEGPFMAWVQGIRKKGSSIPERYITPRVEKLKGNAELHRRMDELSRQMEELRAKLDEMKDDLKTQRK